MAKVPPDSNVAEVARKMFRYLKEVGKLAFSDAQKRAVKKTYELSNIANSVGRITDHTMHQWMRHLQKQKTLNML